ncbi:MAG TPA: RNA methyltransferase [Bacteroidales bacterium]|nr:RNA methyltransferase [Bacteroidales bacterium]
MKKKIVYTNALIDYLSGFITENRLDKFNKIINLRTRFITIVLEDIYQPHNASAVLRSCECIGVQDVHIIENKNKYEINPNITLGSSKWLTLIRYNQIEYNTSNCIKNLKKTGYQIVATSSNLNGQSIEQISVDKKIALFFGTEKDGVSNDVIDNADCFVKIPMFGFTESFNISVSVAICLYSLTNRLRKSDIIWQLTEEEKSAIKLQWLKNSIKNANAIESDFKKKFII